MTLLTDKQREEVVEAMARAARVANGYPDEPSGQDNDLFICEMESALTAALPAIERAVMKLCLNEAAAVAYQQDADHGAANTGGADEILHRLRALAGEVG